MNVEEIKKEMDSILKEFIELVDTNAYNVGQFVHVMEGAIQRTGHEELKSRLKSLKENAKCYFESRRKNTV